MMTIRTCTTRVRSGCLTCKRRRRKCDEEKPACRNCVSTNRICQGYVDPFREVIKGAKRELGDGSSALGRPYLAGLQVADSSTSRNYVSFRYLSEEVLGFSSEIIVREAMQRSLSQPSIHHAMLALSPHIESFACNHRVRNFEVERNTYMLRHYGQALKCIRQTLSDEMNEEQQIEILTVVCLIISLELVRGTRSGCISASCRGSTHSFHV